MILHVCDTSKKKTFLSLYSLFKRSIQIWNLCAYKFSTRRHLVKVHVVNLIIGLSQSTKNWDSDFFAYQMMCDSALKKKLKFFQNLIFTGDFFFKINHLPFFRNERSNRKLLWEKKFLF